LKDCGTHPPASVDVSSVAEIVDVFSGRTVINLLVETKDADQVAYTMVDKESQLSLTICLEELTKQISPTSSCLVSVRRDYIVSDCLAAVRRSSFNPKKTIIVEFVGEEGDDTGGLLREMWRLLAQSLSEEGPLLQGPPFAKVPRHNVVSIQVILTTLY
jgi:hypothetical protein